MFGCRAGQREGCFLLLLQVNLRSRVCVLSPPWRKSRRRTARWAELPPVPVSPWGSETTV